MTTKKLLVLILSLTIPLHSAYAQIAYGPNDTNTPELTLDRGDVTAAGALTVPGLSTLNGQVALGSETVAGAGTTVAAFTALTGIKPIICVKTAALTYLCA